MADGTGADSQLGIDVDEIAYADAIRELDQILQRIEVADIDVDVLSSQVERAAHLLRVCRSRISRAETRIKDVLAEMEEDATWQADSSEAPEGD